MKITMYELLGLVKDGKAPKKIIYDGYIWEFKEETYYSNNICIYDWCNMMNVLNDTVEILEEQKKIEKIELDDENIVDYYDGSKHYLNTNRKDRDIYIKKINEIIDYLNSKGDE